MTAGLPAQTLMPLPAQMTRGAGALPVSPGFSVAVPAGADPLVRKAADRFITRLQKRTGVQATLVAGSSGTLILAAAGPARVPQSPEDDESYSLRITPGNARLDAPNPLGIIRGLETMLQWLDGNVFPAVSIQDQPRYAWRGLMLDVSRHFMPFETVLRQLDGMAAMKMNVFHWHLSDDQGVRVESKLFPRLQTHASDGKFYTQDQIRKVVEYARERGIRVMPEFDMPGHATAFLAAYPSLSSGPPPTRPAKTWNMLNYIMDPTREETYTFIERFFGEMATLFPDRYFHIGGDETNQKPWRANPRIVAFMKKHRLTGRGELQAHFNKRLSVILGKLNRTMVGWDETLHPDLPTTTIVQSWRGKSALGRITAAGHRGMLSNGYYLDHMKSAGYHYENDPGEGDRILGGEACMWVEYVTAENVDTRIWPRLAVIAERLWSPAGAAADTSDMYRRLPAISQYLSDLGVEHLAQNRRMLTRLAGKQPVAPLETLASALEPVKMYARSTSRPYTTDTPMNRLVDALPPESLTARDFAQNVERMLGGNADARRQARTQLEQWRDNHKAVLPVLQGSPLLAENIATAEYVRDVAAIGVQTLDYLDRSELPAQAWYDRANALLDTDGKRKPPLATQKACFAVLGQYSRRHATVRRNCAEPRYLDEVVPVMVEPVRRLLNSLKPAAVEAGTR